MRKYYEVKKMPIWALYPYRVVYIGEPLVERVVTTACDVPSSLALAGGGTEYIASVISDAFNREFEPLYTTLLRERHENKRLREEITQLENRLKQSA